MWDYIGTFDTHVPHVLGVLGMAGIIRAQRGVNGLGAVYDGRFEEEKEEEGEMGGGRKEGRQ